MSTLITTRNDMRTVLAGLPAASDIAIITQNFNYPHLGHYYLSAKTKEICDYTIVAFNHSGDGLTYNEAVEKLQRILSIKDWPADYVYLDDIQFQVNASPVIDVESNTVYNWIIDNFDIYKSNELAEDLNIIKGRLNYSVAFLDIIYEVLQVFDEYSSTLNFKMVKGYKDFVYSFPVFIDIFDDRKTPIVTHPVLSISKKIDRWYLNMYRWPDGSMASKTKESICTNHIVKAIEDFEYGTDSLTALITLLQNHISTIDINCKYKIFNTKHQTPNLTDLRNGEVIGNIYEKANDVGDKYYVFGEIFWLGFGETDLFQAWPVKSFITGMLTNTLDQMLISTYNTCILENLSFDDIDLAMKQTTIDYFVG